MKKRLQFARMLLLLFLAFSFQNSFAQVTLTATSGTATGSFTTLKGAFDAINLGTHKGAIVIKINANTTESASASLTASAALATSAPYYTGVTIYPTVTGLSITGNLAAPLINLNGADNVTIDGRVNATGSAKDLTISNTSAVATAGTSTIRFIADASSNAVMYCILKGSSTDASAGIVFFSTATTTGNDNNTVTENDITCAADASRPLNAIYALGTTLKNNDSNLIVNNDIYNFLSKSTASNGIQISAYNSGYTISGNSFYETASFVATGTINYNVILISAATGTENGFKVSDNYIGGSDVWCEGTPWTKTAQNNAFTAISVTTSTGTANNIQGNTIQNINWTNAGTGAFTAISLAGTTVANIGTVTGNTIGAATGTGSITFTSTTTATDFYGIKIASTDAVDCQNNTIGAIKVDNAATNATNFYGIYKSATAGATTITKNTIGSTTTASSINASSASSGAIQSVYGIQSAGTGIITISGNTIAKMVNATSNATTTSAGLISGIYVSSGTNTISKNTVRDLSIANANISITSTASVSGIFMANATAAAQTISGNTIYNLNNSNASFAGVIIGIYYSGSTTASAVKANFIHSLYVTGASSTTASLYGIKIDAGAATYSNNIISLGGTTKTDLFGIYQTGAASNNNSLFYNTVSIAGSLPSGATNTSYALYSTGILNTRDFTNNIFVNARSTVAGVNKHYALYIAASGGTITCNYNNYFVSGSGGVLGYFGADKTALPLVTSNDANSIITNPKFINAGGTTASDYTATITGEAINTTGINVDYAGSIRGTNVTMGAFELKGAPDQPLDVVATAGINALAIAFTAPTAVGGGKITNYQYSLDSGSTWITPSPAILTSPLKIDGLTNCTDYGVKIRAVNIIGGGTASATATATPKNGQPAGTKWTEGTSAADNSWQSVTYSNGLFVAVSNDGTGNRVMTSPDGTSWTSRTSAADNSWRSVTYGNGLFVAVSSTGTGNRVMTSPDGISWTSRTSASDNYWNSVTYGNGLFVAVSMDGVFNFISKRVMTSPDGINWTLRTTPAVVLNSVTYGNGLFVAVGQSGVGQRVMTSTDGIDWTLRSSVADNNWSSVTYGNGLFVAVSADGTIANKVMTSSNGVDWTARATELNNAWGSVTYGKGMFVAVAYSTYTYPIDKRVMTSQDGITWAASAAGPEKQWWSVTYGNGLFVSVGGSGTGTRVMTSSDALAPDSPSITAITPAATTAAVAFTAPANSGFSAITNYEYSINNGSSWITRSPVSIASPLTIAGLTGETAYNIQLRAVNSAGASCGSAMVSTTTLVPTPAPTSAAQTICRGATVATLVASGTNLKWYNVASGGTALVTTAVLSTGTFYVSQTVNSVESARTSVVVTVNTTPQPTASAQTFCNFAVVENLVATGSALKWYNVAIAGTSLPWYTPLATGTYYVSQTLNGCESARTAFPVRVNTTAAPTATAQTFCSGATVANLVATGTSLKWYDVATNGTPLAASTALATGTYYDSQTLNGCESARISVVVTVNTTVAPTATAQTFCNNESTIATVKNLVATGTTLTWYNVASGGMSLMNRTDLITGTYYVSQTLNSCESERTAVTVTVNVTSAPTATAQTFCHGATVADIVATGTNLHWSDANANALTSTTVLATGTYYVVSILNGCESALTSVDVTVNTSTAPTAAAQTFNISATVADLVATGTALQWYTAETGGTALATSIALASGMYYVSQTINSCESARTAVATKVSTTTLSVPSVTHSNQVLIYKQDDKIRIDTGSIIMTGVQVYDLNGRLLLERKNINANQLIFSIATAANPLLIKMTSNDGQVITKKIIN